jgi:hypothetical protein
MTPEIRSAPSKTGPKREERRGEEGGEKSVLDALRAKSEAAGAHLISGALGVNELLGIRATIEKSEGCERLHGVIPGADAH